MQSVNDYFIKFFSNRLQNVVRKVLKLVIMCDLLLNRTTSTLNLFTLFLLILKE